jgi:hypothetical protein
LVAYFVQTHRLGIDFQGWYWPAGSRILQGQSPYLLPYPNTFVYPPFTALLFVPLALMPRAIAAAVFTSLLLLAVPGTLRVLDVRDWRVYGAVMLWPAVVYGWETANVSILLALGVAALWRLRGRGVIAGVIVGTLIPVKPFLWPVALWLLATRRYTAFLAAVASAAALSLVGFVAIGLPQIARYVTAVHSWLVHNEPGGYGLTSFVIHAGGGQPLADAVALAAAVVLGAVVIVLGFRGHERQALGICIAASLLASPMVESHYLVLLVVALALMRPRFDVTWLIPLALWLTPIASPAQWQRGLALGAIGLMGALAAGPRPHAGPWRRWHLFDLAAGRQVPHERSGLL